MHPLSSKTIESRTVGNGQWLKFVGETPPISVRGEFDFNVLESEEAIGHAMLDELLDYAEEKDGDIVFVLLGGRGAQAMYRRLAAKALSSDLDDVFARLHVFTQDALAPMRMDNGLSFVRDFERLL